MSEDSRPNICKVLGVKINERFKFKGSNPNVFYINKCGLMKESSLPFDEFYEDRDATPFNICYAINKPEEILHISDVTDKELNICKAIGAKYVSKDASGVTDTVDLWNEEPEYSIEHRAFIGKNKARIIASIESKLFPSVTAGQCICVQ